MAQTRLEKIGTIYSRLVGLQKTGAVKYEDRPVWFDVYEAFPPKYEPRWDRHLLNYGKGCNVAAMGPPKPIYYEEDEVRARFYKVFYSEELAPEDRASFERPVPKHQETFNLFPTADKRDCLAQTFVKKYEQMKGKGEEPNKIFRATVEALELDGVHLMKPAKPEESEAREESEEGERKPSFSRPPTNRPSIKRPSLKDIFAMESERDKEEE